MLCLEEMDLAQWVQDQRLEEDQARAHATIRQFVLQDLDQVQDVPTEEGSL